MAYLRWEVCFYLHLTERQLLTKRRMDHLKIEKKSML